MKHFHVHLLVILASTGSPLLAQTSSDGPTPKTVPVPKLPEFTRKDPAAYGRELATYADRFDEGWRDSYARNRVTLFSGKGDSVVRDTVILYLERRGGDKSLIRFLAPAELKGVAALTHEHEKAVDDSWLYLPSSKRVRRISGANKTASFQGTEFTYEDLSNLIVAKYAWRFLGEKTIETPDGSAPVFQLEARPQYRDTGYSRLVVSIHREHWRRERVEYQDKAGRPLKVLDQSKWRQFHGRFWRPLKLEVRNLQTKKRTTIESQQMLLDLRRYKSKRTGKPRAGLTDEQFSARGLAR